MMNTINMMNILGKSAIYDDVGPQDPPIRLVISIRPKLVQTVINRDVKIVVYEIQVSNAANAPIRIQAIRSVFNTECNILNKIISGDKLEEIYAPISAQAGSSPNDTLLPPSETGIFFMYWTFPKKQCLSGTITNTLYLQIENNPSTLQSITTKPICIEDKYIIISPPLRGDKWYCTNGLARISAHRTGKIIVNGVLWFPETYAIDFLQYGKYGLFSGDGSRNEDWYCYGALIYSVSFGTVVHVKTGIPDNKPGERIEVVTEDTISGNCIVVKLDCDNYAVYAHMISDSIRVKVGDQVKDGQVLGRLGNSGVSDAAHLHFEILRENRVIDGPPAAYGFDRYLEYEYVPSDQDDQPENVEVVGQTVRCMQIPLDKDLVKFWPDKIDKCSNSGKSSLLNLTDKC